jgi:hypothetical protein
MKFKPDSTFFEKVVAIILWIIVGLAGSAWAISTIMICYNLFMAIWVDIKAFGVALKWGATFILSFAIVSTVVHLIEEFTSDTIDFD